MDNAGLLNSFQYLENGQIEYTHLKTLESHSKLRPGSYSLSYRGYPINRVIVDEVKDIESKPMISFSNDELVKKSFSSFFNPEIKEQVNKLGFKHKVGYLFHGEQGTGKTSIVKSLCQKAIMEQGAIVFYLNMKVDDLESCWDFMIEIRKIQDNPFMIIIDEMDRLLTTPNSKEAELKIMLDGDKSIDNSVVFGMTNYISKLSDAIKNRPSRFKYCIEMDKSLKEDTIYSIVQEMTHTILTEEEVNNMVSSLKNENIDTIKQQCLDVVMGLQEFKPIKTNKKLGF